MKETLARAKHKNTLDTICSFCRLGEPCVSWVMRVFLWGLLGMCTSAALASKDRGVYIGAGANLINAGFVDPFNNEVDFKAGELILGYKHNPFFGVEIRGGASFQEESVRVEDTTTGLRSSVSTNLDSYQSVYYRPEVANEIAKLYALLGYSSAITGVEFEQEGLAPLELEDASFSYGFGFGLWLDERMNLNFEYRLIVTTENDAYVTTSINADYRF